MPNTECWLMHGDIRVASIVIGPYGSLASVNDILAPEHLPTGVSGNDRERCFEDLFYWWSKRSIPLSREGIKTLLDSIGAPGTEYLQAKSLGLSLSDSYWIKPKVSEMEWSDVNFYDNDFSEDVGKALFNPGIHGIERFDSPDSSSDGNLKKRWIIAGGTRYLLKAGSGQIRQEPYNEVIASEVMRRLGVDHVDYALTHMNREVYCTCPAFTSRDVELVPAWAILKGSRREEGQTLYEFVRRSLESFGIDDCTGFLDRMICTDFIIANEDRHFGNFGIIRNPESLEVKGFAPMFDSGTSLGSRIQTVWIEEGYDLLCKPFKVTHGEQIHLVKSFDWLELDRLDGMPERVLDIFHGAGGWFDEHRAEVVSGYLEKRVEKLRTIIDNPLFRDDPRLDMTLSDSLVHRSSSSSSDILQINIF